MTTKGIAKLGKMKVNQLQAMFAEVVGETTRSPNRTYLIRRIKEAIAAAEQNVAVAARKEVRAEPATESEALSGMETATPQLTKLDLPSLQAYYHEVIGRPTSSMNRDYLIWKIREAQKGRLPIGPRPHRQKPGETLQVLPLRMESNVVSQLDEAWRRLGLRSRMDLFRVSLRTYLTSVGESAVANLVAADA